ncbi:hypothetical protein [Methylotetracoccus oryzae]|uniref:hypothetical protein n=1 Tax=Methylotetracoccus oryzae TaxID=1919059 RepID=UPI0011183446|nr:hypothetical protein [Methylotetracoccus oryzae]
MKSLFRLALGLGSLGVAAVAAAHSVYQLTEVPVLRGYTSGYANSINDNGDVAGYCQTAASAMTYVGFTYRNGVLSSTGKSPKKGNYSSANFVSVTGVVVGSADTGDFRPQGFVKTGNSMVNVFPNNGGNTHALRIDDAGRVYGHFIRRGTADWQGAMWTPDPRKPGRYNETILGGAGFPMAFNSMGKAVGYSSTGRQTAALWNNSGPRAMQLLQTRPEYTSSLAYGISDNGNAVGSGHPAFSSRALLWRARTGYALEELPLLPGDNYGGANAINRAGVILGTSAYGVPGTWNIGPSTPIVWDRGVPAPLDSLLDPASSVGWRIDAAVGINNQGQIVANATKDGISRVVVLTPIQ